MTIKYAPRSDDPWDKEKGDILGEKEVEKDKRFDFDKVSRINFADPTIIIAAISIFFYIFVSTFYISYFRRLSIPFDTLDLPFTFYLSSIYSILYILYYLIIIAIVFIEIPKIFKYYKIAKGYKEILMVLMYGFFISIIIVLFSSILLNLIKNLLVVFLIIFMISTWGLDLYKIKTKNQKKSIIYYIIFILIFVTIFTPNLGRTAAENLIKGDIGGFEIKLDLKNESPELLNRTLILVTHSNYKYYLIEKNESVPKEVNLYIIPDDQIKMITVKPIEKEQREFYEFYKDWRIY